MYMGFGCYFQCSFLSFSRSNIRDTTTLPKRVVCLLFFLFDTVRYTTPPFFQTLSRPDSRSRLSGIPSRRNGSVQLKDNLSRDTFTSLTSVVRDSKDCQTRKIFYLCSSKSYTCYNSILLLLILLR